MSSSATPWTVAHQASLPFTISWSLLRFMSIELMMLSSHFILCCPLLFLPSVFPSIRVFSNEWRLLNSVGQSIGTSASASVSPMHIQSSYPLEWTSLILLFKRLSRVFSSTTTWKHQFFSTQPSLWSNSCIYI